MKIPENVASFLREVDRLRSPDLRINPLTLEASARMTAAVQNFEVSRELGLIVLNN